MDELDGLPGRFEEQRPHLRAVAYRVRQAERRQESVLMVARNTPNRFQGVAWPDGVHFKAYGLRRATPGVTFGFSRQLRGELTAPSSRTLSTRDFSGEGLEPRAPEPPERLQPDDSLSQRACVNGIDAARPLGTHRRKPALPQDPELLRHGRLGDAELPRDDVNDLAGRMLALDKEFQDAPSNRIAEDIERVHQEPV